MCLEDCGEEMTGGRVRNCRCEDSVQPVRSLRTDDGDETSVGKFCGGWTCSHERRDSWR